MACVTRQRRQSQGKVSRSLKRIAEAQSPAFGNSSLPFCIQSHTDKLDSYARSCRRSTISYERFAGVGEGSFVERPRRGILYWSIFCMVIETRGESPAVRL